MIPVPCRGRSRGRAPTEMVFFLQLISFQKHVSESHAIMQKEGFLFLCGLHGSCLTVSKTFSALIPPCLIF